MGISTRGISASEKPRLVQGVGAGSGEYSPEQQAERRFWVSRLCRVRTLQRLGIGRNDPPACTREGPLWL